MHFLDAWTGQWSHAAARLLFPALVLAITAFLPGRRVARFTAITMAALMPVMREAVPPWPIGAAWMLLWVVVAWRAGPVDSEHYRPRAARPGAVESGTVGVLLGVALFAFLVAAVARQNLGPGDTRRAAVGLLVMCLGLLHLMLRRDVVRAKLAFAALGLGLQVLQSVAAQTLLPGDTAGSGNVLLATATAVVLADRLARVRQQDAGSAWVSDAHDLHD